MQDRKARLSCISVKAHDDILAADDNHQYARATSSYRQHQQVPVDVRASWMLRAAVASSSMLPSVPQGHHGERPSWRGRGRIASHPPPTCRSLAVYSEFD